MKRSAMLPGTWRSLTIGGAVRAAAERDPRKVAIVAGTITIDFATLSARADCLRDAVITTLRLTPGETVAIVARNRPEFIEVVAGVPDAGVAVATVNPRLTPAEMKVALDDSLARVVFVDPGSAATVAASEVEVPVITFGENYEALLAGAGTPTALPLVDEWDAWTIPYTSGTTGRPKGVVLPHRARLVHAGICAAEFGCFGPDDRFLAMTPMNHGGGLGFPIGVLANGGSIEILDQFDAETTLERLSSGTITGLFMVPTHFAMIFALPPDVLDRYRRPPIKAILANAAPLSQAMKEKIIPYFGETVLHELYAATETGLVCNLRPQYQLLKERCVGTPFAHHEVEIRHDDGSVCAADEVGELWARGPVLFNGYWNRPEATAEAVRDGWVSVGDLARRDADGFIYIVDRRKDMVITGGVNVYPREIEEVLLTHPAIADVAVIGVPDEQWGERLRTIAVVRNGATLSAGDVVDFCTGKLASYKIPRDLALLDALPRNANGKVLKTELRLRN